MKIKLPAIKYIINMKFLGNISNSAVYQIKEDRFLTSPFLKQYYSNMMSNSNYISSCLLNLDK